MEEDGIHLNIQGVNQLFCSENAKNDGVHIGSDGEGLASNGCVERIRNP